MSIQTKHFYQFGPFCLDPVKRRLLRDGEVVKLTPKAFETLLALVEQRGKTIEKNELLNKVWAGVAVEENNLNQSITALRKSLGDSRQESRYIATIPGVGYRFVADVKEIGIESPSQSVAVSPVSTRVPRALRYVLLVLIPLALAAVVCALLTREESPPQAAVSSIMVLPLENLSGDPSQEYFADGVTDITPAALVNVYIGLDRKDQAFVWLERAFQERSNYLAYLKVFPIMDPLRSDPRFADLVQRVGLSS